MPVPGPCSLHCRLTCLTERFEVSKKQARKKRPSLGGVKHTFYLTAGKPVNKATIGGDENFKPIVSGFSTAFLSNYRRPPFGFLFQLARRTGARHSARQSRSRATRA